MEVTLTFAEMGWGESHKEPNYSWACSMTLECLGRLERGFGKHSIEGDFLSARKAWQLAAKVNRNTPFCSMPFQANLLC